MWLPVAEDGDVTYSPEVSVSGEPGPILYFDGVCNLCSAAVRFVLDHERSHLVRFASIQGTHGAALRSKLGLSPDAELTTMYLEESGEVFSHSTAVLRLARHLKFPFSLGWYWLFVPRFLRDMVYRFVAKRRYRWFGQTEVCYRPTDELRSRFLD